MDILFYFLGAIALIIGIALNIWVNKQRFYRRGPGGLQHFDSYSKSVFTRAKERVAKVIAWLLIVFGIAALLYGHKIQTDPGYEYGVHPKAQRSS